MQRIWGRRKATTGHRYKFKTNITLNSSLICLAERTIVHHFCGFVFVNLGLFNRDWHLLLNLVCKEWKLIVQVNTILSSANFGVSISTATQGFIFKLALSLMNTFKVSVFPESYYRGVPRFTLTPVYLPLLCLVRNTSEYLPLIQTHHCLGYLRSRLQLVTWIVC